MDILSQKDKNRILEADNFFRQEFVCQECGNSKMISGAASRMDHILVVINRLISFVSDGDHDEWEISPLLCEHKNAVEIDVDLESNDRIWCNDCERELNEEEIKARTIAINNGKFNKR